MRKCEHNTVEAARAHRCYRCVACRALGVRSLGPSNDSGEAVRVEMRAAELSAPSSVPLSSDEAIGYGWHGQWHRVEPTFTSEAWSGWLASEMDTHDDDDRAFRDASAWPWDPARPVAEQGPDELSVACQAAESTCDRVEAALNGVVESLVDVLADLPPDALDDEHFDPVDGKFDDGGDCDVLPDGEAR